MTTGRIVIYNSFNLSNFTQKTYCPHQKPTLSSAISYTVCFSVLVTVYVPILWCLAHISFDLLFCNNDEDKPLTYTYIKCHDQ